MQKILEISRKIEDFMELFFEDLKGVVWVVLGIF